MEQIHGGDIYRNQILYDFSVNTNPYGPPEGLIKELKNKMAEIANYPDVFCETLRNDLALKEQILPSQILCTNGAAEFFFAFCQAVKPKKALLQTPAFAEYENALRTVDCDIYFYETKAETGFCLQEDILEKLDASYDVLFLCTPNNPTGICIEEKLLLSVMEKCKKEHIFLVLDICFLDFVKNNNQAKFIHEMQKNEYLILVKAFTKLYTIPGIRLGYGMSSNTVLLQKLQTMLQPWNVSTLAQIAGIAAMKEVSFVEESLEMICMQKKYLLDEMEKLGVKCFHTQTNYILFKEEKSLYDEFLNHQILIRDCSNYRGLEKGYYRIAVKKKEDNEFFLKILKQILKERRK